MQRLRTKLWGDVKQALPSYPVQEGEGERKGLKAGGGENGFVCVEETIDKREHMCMCERTRWESM